MKRRCEVCDDNQLSLDDKMSFDDYMCKKCRESYGRLLREDDLANVVIWAARRARRFERRAAKREKRRRLGLT